jgi:azurin
MRSLHVAFLALTLTAACGRGDAQSTDTKGTTNPPPTTQVAPTASVVPTPEPTVAPKPVQHVELQIASVANTMTFDKTALTVPTGAEVHLVLKNNATMSTLPHNWVLVKTGTEASVAAAGLKYDQAGYVDVRDHDMLAHTIQAKPGDTAEVTFTAPDPGTYPYICTTPGHYMMMKGVLTVTP